MSAVADAIVAELTAKAGGCECAQAQSVPWFSATFAGERHEIVLTLSDGAAVERLIRDLNAHQFALPRTMVADIVAVRCRDDRRRVSVETLTIDEEG